MGGRETSGRYFSRTIVSDFSVHSRGIILADVVGNLQHLHSNRAGAHGDLDAVAHFDIIAGFDNPAVDADAAIVAGFVGNGAALDEPGDLQKFVQAHGLLGDAVLKSLAGLEAGNPGGGNLDGLLGVGIAADAGLTILGFENAEAGEPTVCSCPRAQKSQSF